MKLFSTRLGFDADRDTDYLLLGGWCLEKPQFIEGYSYVNKKICRPFGFLERERKLIDELVSEYYPKLLKDLADSLNEYHGVNFEKRYWEIIVGSWVFRFLQLTLNRYFQIKTAIKIFPEIRSHHCIKGELEILVGLDEFDSVRRIASDGWNSILYRYLFEKYFQNIENIYVDVCEGVDEHRRKESWKLIFANKGFLNRNDEFFLYKTYLHNYREIALHLALGQVPVKWYSTKKIADAPFDKNVRSQLLQKTTRTEVEKVLWDVIPLLLPKAFLESYQQNIEVVKSYNWPDKPRLIYTANGFAGDLHFQMWLAQKSVVEKVNYLVGQHGNNYGTLAWSWLWPELTTPNGFISWGWKTKQGNCSRVIKGYNFIGRKLSKGNSKSVMIVMRGAGNRSAAACRYFEFMIDLNNAHKLASFFENKSCWSVSIRAHHGTSFKVVESFFGTLVSKPGSNVSLDKGIAKISRLSKNFGLLIFTYDSTGFLEALQNNKPCLAIFEEWQERLTPSASKDYEVLIKVGIIHHSIESIQTQLTGVLKNLERWWEDENLQLARRYFVNKYSCEIDESEKSLAEIIQRF